MVHFHAGVLLKSLLDAFSDSGITIYIGHGEKYRIFNTELTLSWDASTGNLIRIQVSGEDENGTTLTFYKDLIYDANDNLIKVSKWVKV